MSEYDEDRRERYFYDLGEAIGYRKGIGCGIVLAFLAAAVFGWFRMWL